MQGLRARAAAVAGTGKRPEAFRTRMAHRSTRRAYQGLTHPRTPGGSFPPDSRSGQPPAWNLPDRLADIGLRRAARAGHAAHEACCRCRLGPAPHARSPAAPPACNRRVDRRSGARPRWAETRPRLPDSTRVVALERIQGRVFIRRLFAKAGSRRRVVNSMVRRLSPRCSPGLPPRDG